MAAAASASALAVAEDEASDLTGFVGVPRAPVSGDTTEIPADTTGSIDIPLDGDDDVPPGPRREVVVLAVVALLALAAAGGFATWWFALRVPTHVIPDLVGVSQDEGVRRLESLGYEVETTFIRRDGTTPDEITALDPRGGDVVARG